MKLSPLGRRRHGQSPDIHAAAELFTFKPCCCFVTNRCCCCCTCNDLLLDGETVCSTSVRSSAHSTCTMHAHLLTDLLSQIQAWNSRCFAVRQKKCGGIGTRVARVTLGDKYPTDRECNACAFVPVVYVRTRPPGKILSPFLVHSTFTVRLQMVNYVNCILGTYCKGAVDKKGDKILTGRTQFRNYGTSKEGEE